MKKENNMKLAINGGPKLRTDFFPAQTNIGVEEEQAVQRVIRSGNLSHYRGSYIPAFYGGVECRKFEEEIADRFNAKYAISCNSATSGLIIALGAIGIRPGEEVIVSPYSMSCSATAPLWWNAVPVFADVEKEYFCIDAKSTADKINERTKCVLPVSLFGQPYDVYGLRAKIKTPTNISVIEDAAQAIGSSYIGIDENKYYAGTLGDLGIFSFTQGKILYAGEGGCILTNSSNLADRCRLIRNHAEAVLSSMENRCDRVMLATDFNNNMLGMNLRMTEIQAAIMREQLKKLDSIIEKRRKNVKLLNKGICDVVPAIRPCGIRKNCTHSFYVDPYFWNMEKADGLHRDKYIEAVKAELTESVDRIDRGVPIGCGYIQPLYRMPLFQERKLYGGSEFPFNVTKTNLVENYSPLSHPIVEDLWKNKLFVSLYHGLDLTDNDINDIIDAFHKVWICRGELR